MEKNEEQQERDDAGIEDREDGGGGAGEFLSPHGVRDSVGDADGACGIAAGECDEVVGDSGTRPRDPVGVGEIAVVGFAHNEFGDDEQAGPEEAFDGEGGADGGVGVGELRGLKEHVGGATADGEGGHSEDGAEEAHVRRVGMNEEGSEESDENEQDENGRGCERRGSAGPGDEGDAGHFGRRGDQAPTEDDEDERG